jgi:cell division protease FtsH
MSRSDSSQRSPQRSPLLPAVLAVVVLLALGALGFRFLAPNPPGTEVGLDEIRAAALAGDLDRATLLDQDAVVVGVDASGQERHAAYPASDAATAQLVADLAEGGVAVRVDPQVDKAVVGVLVTVVLPLVLLAALFAIVLVATREGAGGGVAGFGRFRGRGAQGHERPEVRFADVAGIDEAVIELREVVDHLRDPSRLAALGGRPPKGVLLAGPPGVGKTLVARAVAGEAGVAFFSVSGAEFVESLVGVGAARVRDLFSQVRAAAPAIVFIDEVDAAGRRRGAGGAVGGTDEREQTLNQLLVEMDGFSETDGIVVLAATNRPDILDPALLRPGRFDRQIEIGRPDLAARTAILRLYAAARPTAADVDLGAVAARTPGFTGADLAAVANEASLLAARDGSGTVTQANLLEGVERVRSGPRASQVLTDEERHRVAVHEAGRAVVLAALGRSDAVTRLSAVPRGRSLGRAVHGGDAVLRSAADLRADLVADVAGRTAELLELGDASTLGEDDLARATATARELVGAHALHDRLPYRRLLVPRSEGHLGDTALDAVLGADLRSRFDDAVDAELAEAVARATELLTVHAEVTRELVAVLDETETVEGATLARLLGRVAAPGAVAAASRS